MEAYVELTANADSTWEQFKGNNPGAHPEIKATLIRDQRGLCAYCEIDLAQYGGQGLDDFRVEHFHPKKRPPHPPPNHDLNWQNLLGVCSGGNVRDIGDPGPFTKNDYSCDEPKGHKNLTGVILNPLTDIPSWPPIFAFTEDGGMKVSLLCPPHLQKQVQASLTELRLTDNVALKPRALRLDTLRKGVIDWLRDQLLIRQAQGKTLEEVSAELAEEMFPSDPEQPWPAFFSCIRWYLGPAAEARLQAVGYDA